MYNVYLWVLFVLTRSLINLNTVIPDHQIQLVWSLAFFDMLGGAFENYYIISISFLFSYFISFPSIFDIVRFMHGISIDIFLFVISG